MSYSQLASLIKMLNHISANNNWQGETEETAIKVASHIERFWARSMKADILNYLEKDGAELSKLSRMALMQMQVRAAA